MFYEINMVLKRTYSKNFLGQEIFIKLSRSVLEYQLNDHYKVTELQQSWLNATEKSFDYLSWPVGTLSALFLLDGDIRQKLSVLLDL